MSRSKKILLWGMLLPAAAAALLAAASLLAASYLNSAPVRTKITEALSRKLDTPVSYGRLEIEWFPVPAVIARDARLTVADTFSGTASSLAFSPRIGPLLTGKLQLARVRMDRPRVTITPGSETKGTASLTLAAVRKKIAETFASLNTYAPGLVLQIGGGSFTLVLQNRGIVSLETIDARFTALPAGIEMKLRGTSPDWGPVALAGTWTFDPAGADIRSVSGTLGHSSLAGLSARLDWREAARLEIRSGSAHFAIDELFRRLHADEFLAPLLPQIKALHGAVTVSSLTADGPLSRPEEWRLHAAGSLENVSIESPLLPFPLSAAAQFSIDQDHGELHELRVSVGKSALSRASARIDWRAPARVRISSAAAVLDLDEFARWRAVFGVLEHYAGAVNRLSGTVRLTSFSLSGPVQDPGQWNVAAAGAVEHVVIEARPLPAQLSIAGGTFNAAPRVLNFQNVEASLGDATLGLSGSLEGPLTHPSAVDLTGEGTIGPQGLVWLYSLFNLQKRLLLRTPLAFSHLHLSWQKTSALSLTGTFGLPEGLKADLALQSSPGELIINRAAVIDQDSNASLTLRRSGQALAGSFSGTLSYRTLNRLFLQPMADSGMLQGSLKASLTGAGPGTGTAEGRLQGGALVVPGIPGPPLAIEHFSLHAAGGILSIDSAVLSREGRRYNLNGTVAPSAGGFVVDGDLTADLLDLNDLRDLVKEKTGRLETPTAAPAETSLYGVLRFDAGSMRLGRFVFKPLRGFATRETGRMSASVVQADLCGVAVAGTVVYSGGELVIDAISSAVRRKVEPALACLGEKEVRLSGTFDLRSELHSQGPADAWLRNLDGTVDITARDGAIYKYPLLAKIFSVLSVTEILRAKLPELGTSGFPYHTITMQGSVHKGILKLDRFLMEGATLDVIAEGDLDLPEKKIDAVVLVAPFSTVNWIIRHLPLVGKIMGGTLVSVPVKVSGNLADPEVTFLAPSAVGTRMLEILENIVRIPVEIISPLLPGDKKKNEVIPAEKPHP